MFVNCVIQTSYVLSDFVYTYFMSYWKASFKDSTVVEDLPISTWI